MEIITSKDNPKFKKLSSLITSKKERCASGMFVVEGLRLTMDAIKSGFIPEELFFSETFSKRFCDKLDEICGKCKNSYIISDRLADKLSDTKTPQGIFAVFAAIDKNTNIDTIYNNGHFIFAVSLQDPGNVGTIIRTAEAMGLDGVILTADCPELYSPKVIRSTMGSLFRIPVVITDNALDTVKKLHRKGFTTYAAVLDNDSVKLGEENFAEKSVALIGNEANGLKEDICKACQKKLMIPMKGNAESLNAASAASIIMWEMSK